jgi:16S rRNA (cytidine1402-2'-O)-methyltransferase
MSTLYLVATPIGNLEDMTLRAIRVLREVSLIAAEDTRTTRVLLNHYQIATRATSYHQYNKIGKLDAILQALDAGDVALVSDAGTPGIADPGYELVVEAIARGHAITPIPGACAAVSALAASGLPTHAFVFEGFAPRKPAALERWIERLRDEPRTAVLYESPHRLARTAEALARALPARRLCIACELTKLFESIWRGACADAPAHLREHPPRGEYVLVLSGAGTSPAGGAPAPQVEWSEEQVRQALAELLAAGMSRRDAARNVTQSSGWPRNDVVQLAGELRAGEQAGEAEEEDP